RGPSFRTSHREGDRRRGPAPLRDDQHQRPGGCLCGQQWVVVVAGVVAVVIDVLAAVGVDGEQHRVVRGRVAYVHGVLALLLDVHQADPRFLGGHVGVRLCPEGHLVPDRDGRGGEGGGGAAGLLDDHGVVAGRQRGCGERVQGGAAERFGQLATPVVAG